MPPTKIGQMSIPTSEGREKKNIRKQIKLKPLGDNRIL